MGLFLILSTLLVTGSIYLMIHRGLNFGTDFKGGVRLQYRFSQTVSEGNLRKWLEPLALGDFSVQKIGQTEDNRFVIKLENKENLTTVSLPITEAFQKGLPGQQITVEREESVGPKAGADLRKKAAWAILISWLLMLIYIGYRFDFAFSPGAIIALVHDVTVTLGAFAISQREVSLSVVAALLTIIGYSINDTIVLYDRVRENLAKGTKESLKEVLDRSINETLSRTIITSFTVFLVVLPIYLFGEGEFQNFGFSMTVGVLVGSYSSIFIACPLYLFLKEYGPRLQKRFK